MVMSSDDLSSLVDGLRKLRTGALLQIIAVVISIIIFIYMFISVGALMLFSPRMLTGTVLPTLVGAAITGIVSGILSLIGFIYWFRATNSLREYNPDRLGIGRTGIILTVIGLILVILGGIVVIGSSLLTHISTTTSSTTLTMRSASITAPHATFIILGFVAILGAGGILAFIGWILFSIMLIRLGNLENVSSSLHTAGILYLIGFILSLIPFIGIVGGILILVAVIFIYTGSGDTLNQLKR